MTTQLQWRPQLRGNIAHKIKSSGYGKGNDPFHYDNERQTINAVKPLVVRAGERKNRLAPCDLRKLYIVHCTKRLPADRQGRKGGILTLKRLHPAPEALGSPDA